MALQPLTATHLTITKQLPCVTESLRTFRSTQERAGRVEAELLREDCLSCSSSWLHWLDPAHWLEQSWSQTRVVISVCAGLAALLVLLLACKLLRTISCCCD